MINIVKSSPVSDKMLEFVHVFWTLKHICKVKHLLYMFLHFGKDDKRVSNACFDTSDIRFIESLNVSFSFLSKPGSSYRLK